MEKILTENIINETAEKIAEAIEAGFDDYANAGTVAATEQGSTSTVDVAQQAPKVALAKTAISMSLPSMVGFTQPMQGPAGFVFGLIQRNETNINQQSTDHRPVDPDDQIITRKLVQTEIRSVKLQMTQEAAQDIQALFGNDFSDNFSKFQASGGQVWNGPNRDIAKFFLETGMIRMADKINKDFITWLVKTATLKGTLDIPTMMDIPNLFAGIGELREALYKATHKSGKPFLIVSPRIAAFFSSTLGSTMSSGSTSFEQGRTMPNDSINGYVMTMGDINVYQYDFSDIPTPFDVPPVVTGGMNPATETEDTGIMILGYQGNHSDSASVYYNPYSEYIVQSEDYNTGQPTVFYKVRDAWTTNPLDTYDDTMTNPNLGTTGNVPADNTSSYLMMCKVNFAEKLIQP